MLRIKVDISNSNDERAEIEFDPFRHDFEGTTHDTT